MAIQLGQAFIALHADGAALAGEVRAQMEAAMAEAQATAGMAAGAGAESGAAAAIAAADEATLSLERMGEAGVVAGSEIAAGTAEADAALGRLTAATGEAAASQKLVGTSAVEASAEVTASADRAVVATDRMKVATEQATRSSGLLGMSWKSVGEFAGGAAVYEAIKAAGTYQQQLTRLVTSANETQGNLELVRRGMLAMGTQVGFSGNELAKSMYLVESAGYHGADGLKTLKAAAEIAKQENASLDTTVQAVTTTMRDYNYKAGDSALVASKLNEAVAFGKTNLQDFSSALHSVEPNAAAANIKLEDMLGSLATMTNSGMSAQQAAQNLAHTLSNFEKPSQPMINALAQIGLNSSDLTQGLSKNGLSGTLIEVSNAIKDHMGPAGTIAISALNQNKAAAQSLVTEMQNMPPQVAALSQGLLDGSVSIKDYRTSVREMGGQAGAMGMQFLSLMQSSDGFNSILKGGFSPLQTYLGYMARSTGTVDGLRTALLLTSDGGKKVNDAIAGISAVSAQADGNVAKWNLTQQTFNQKFADAKAAVQNFGIEMGTKLLPILGSVATWVADHVVPAAQKLSDWFGKLANSTGVKLIFDGIKGAASGLAVVIGAVSSVIGTLVGWFTRLPGGVQAAILIIAGLKLVLSTDFFGIFSRGAGKAVTGVAEVAAAAGKARVPIAETGTAATVAGEQTTVATSEMSAGWQRVRNVVTESTAGIRASMAQVSAAYGEAAVASKVSSEIQGASAAESKISGAIAGTQGALGNLAKQGFGAVKSAGAGLFDLMGGPWGAALIVGMGIWQQYSDNVAEVKAAMEKAGSAGVTLGQRYIQLNDIMGQSAVNARQAAIEASGLGDAFKQAKVDTGDLTSALEMNQGAQDKIVNQMQRTGAATDAAKNGFNPISQAIDFFSGKATEGGDAAKKMFDQLNEAGNKGHIFETQISTAGSALDSFHADADKTFGKGSMLNPGMSTLGQGMEELARSAGKTEDSLKGITDIMKGLTGAGVSATDAEAALAETNDQVKHSFDNLATGAVNAKGSIDTSTKAGADLWGSLKNLGSGFDDTVNKAYAAAGGIKGGAAAADAAGTAAGKLYNQFILTAQGAGVSADQAKAYAKQLGLVPGDVVTKYTTPGMGEAQASVDILKGKIIGTPDYKSIHTQALTADAMQQLQTLGFTIETLPDGTMSVTANTANAKNAITSLIGTYQNYPINLSVGARAGSGGAGSAHAMGDIVHAFADGGFSPMAQGVPQIVGPKTWRLIGDRAADDEAYIPLDGSPRSRSLWADAGRRMGLVGAGTGARSGGPVAVTYAPQYTLPPTADPTQVAAMVGANTARDFQLGMESLSSLGWATG